MSWQSGHKIGTRFVVEGRLAIGGMAQVYVAEMQQARGLTRRVALQRVHPHLAEDPAFVSMFVAEARLSGQLAHPGIVPVVDAIEHAGDLMLVMDYVPGWDLKAVLDRARERALEVPVGVAVGIAARAAQTLAYVHSAKGRDGAPLGVVHRDVTPSNLLVGSDGGVRLLDFGVAKAARRSTKTATRAIKGKLAYLAPEQARGQGATPASDVYALGLVLFEMLTGRRAIQGDDDFALMRTAASPDFDPIALHRPDSPESIDALVGRMLAVSPADRPSASEVADTLVGLAEPDDAVRGFVERVMGSSARPIEEGRSAIDQALLSVLAEGSFSGVSLAGARITRPPDEPVAPAPGPDDAPTRAPRLAAVARDGDGVASHEGPPAAIARAPVTAITREPSEPEPDVLAPAASTPAVRNAPTPSRGRASIVIAAITIVGAAGAAGIAWVNGAFGGETPSPIVDPVTPTDAPTGFVRVSTDPAGARVTVDGRPHDEMTPTIVQAPGGTTLHLALELDDHAPVEDDVVVRGGETVQIDRALARLPGSLRITSTPSDAEVLLDGELRGRTPLELHELPRRAIAVEVRADGHRSFETTVDLDATARAEVSPTLARIAPRGGTLRIMAFPLTVAVTVDGRRISGSPPLEVPVGAGRHTVRVTNPANGRSVTRSVQVSGGTVIVAGINLQ
ncbi:MAG: protein kinase [Sandaracinaceae bacterium]